MTRLNARPWWLIRRNLFRFANYGALARSIRVYVHPVDALRRYFFGGGPYPTAIGVRTPLGRRDVVVFGGHDVITIHEIFCRRDYRCDRPRVVVDVGSNIGVSALYFLTRSSSAYCVLYEPLPSNVARLRENLAGLEGRFEVHEAAVATCAGTQAFVVEGTGRYGRLAGTDEGAHETIDVQVLDVNDVLAQVIADHGRVDLLKVDTEGLELDTLHAIRTELRQQIGHLAIEWFGPTEPLPGYRTKRVADVVNYTRI
jgi:FkbM family methyltransferase